MKAITFLMTCLVASLVSPLAQADAEAEIAYRKGVMKIVGGHMTGLGTILRKGVHGEDLQFHARGMANIAAIVPDVFPAGSGDGKTEALKAIWEKPEAFSSAVEKFVTAANNINTAVESGDKAAIGGAIKQLGGSCKGCHDDFRED